MGNIAGAFHSAFSHRHKFSLSLPAVSRAINCPLHRSTSATTPQSVAPVDVIKRSINRVAIDTSQQTIGKAPACLLSSGLMSPKGLYGASLRTLSTIQEGL
jgi:hypothetical protein